MRQFIAWGIAQIYTASQRLCADVDFEVVALPGGSLIAVLLWLCASATSFIRRSATPIRKST